MKAYVFFVNKQYGSSSYLKLIEARLKHIWFTTVHTRLIRTYSVPLQGYFLITVQPYRKPIHTCPYNMFLGRTQKPYHCLQPTSKLSYPSQMDQRKKCIGCFHYKGKQFKCRPNLTGSPGANVIWSALFLSQMS